MSASEFSPELLKLYYERLFPYEKFASWLSYGKGEDLLFLREFSFTLDNDTYIRYKSFRDAKDMKDSMTKTMPYKIDIGAVFSVSPADKGKVRDSDFTPTQRELVFDVDLTDYDDIRTCCQGATICNKCWSFMTAAVKVMDVALREDFGFKHLLWVYSGRRGIHCWVADEQARMLTNDARAAVVSYFTVVEGNENVKRKVILRDPLHPSLERAFKILEPFFEKFIIGEEGQGILCSSEHWNKLLDMVPVESIRTKLSEKWSSEKSSALEKWKQLKMLLQQAAQSVAGSKKKFGDDYKSLMASKQCVVEIVFAYTYPRLDANVSKQRNHLLKSPFAVHPKTGRVCVPIDVDSIMKFDPFNVPTLSDLERELNASNPDAGRGGDVSKTSLAQYITFFESRFLKPLELEAVKAQRAENEENAASTGNW